MQSSTLGLASNASRPGWALSWRRPQVIDEKKQVINDYENFKRTRSSSLRAVQLRRSMADARPCDALRRYMQRAETRATTRRAVAQATHAPRSRWGARPEQPICAEGNHGTRALRLYALTRFSIDETQPSRVYQRLL